MSGGSRPTLFTLPREVRDMVYEYATADFDAPLISRSRRERNVGLLQTCHQMRKEASKAYYQNTAFHEWSSDCIEWLLALDAVTRSRVRRICVTVALSTSGKLSFTEMWAKVAEVRNVPGLDHDCEVTPFVMSPHYQPSKSTVNTNHFKSAALFPSLIPDMNTTTHNKHDGSRSSGVPTRLAGASNGKDVREPPPALQKNDYDQIQRFPPHSSQCHLWGSNPSALRIPIISLNHETDYGTNSRLWDSWVGLVRFLSEVKN